MKIVLQIILIAFAILYFGGAIGAKTQQERFFYFGAGTLLAVALGVSIALLLEEEYHGRPKRRQSHSRSLRL